MTKYPYVSNLSRRDFVTMVTAVLGSLMGVIIGIPVIGYLISPALKSVQSSNSKVSLGALDNYPRNEPIPFSFTQTKINGWEKSFQSYGVFVLHQSDANVKVISNVCTHLSCRVTWHAENKEFICPCHDARFDNEGNVLSGPPPRPLDTYQTEIDSKGNLFIII